MHALAWERLGAYLHETQILGSIQNTLYWDQNTSMPSAGAAWRGEQLSLLAKQLHARQSSKELEELITSAKAEFANSSKLGLNKTNESSDRRRNLELLEQDLKRQRSIDPALVIALARSKAQGYELWQNMFI